MFGLNDSSQNDNPARMDGPAALPQNPFAETAAAAQPAPQAAPKSTSTLSDDQPAGPADNDLLISIKEQALNSLSPLVGHLEQTPEERFKTLMMLIQASDNSNLIKDAYDAANKLPDEKARAQALLDVINEINYFTQSDDKDKA